MKKAGYIAIVGRPNVGKSTLLNALLGEKIAIVSAKPQTTRNRILGILTRGQTQFIFVDTPGIHRPKNSLGDYMVEAAKSSMLEADVVVLMTDVGKPVSAVEENVITYLKQSGVPCVLAETCSRIYYRNAINNGYPVLFVSGISEAIKTGKLRNGDTLEVDLSTGDIHDVDTGADLHGDAVSDLEHEIMEAGGLFQYMKKKAGN